VLPANKVPVDDELNNPTLEMFAAAVTNEFDESNVAVKRTVFDVDDDAAVTDALF
jgi:hypothetical protein